MALPATGTPQWTKVRLLAAASGVSAFGSFLNMVVLGLFAFELTGSALLTGVFMALRLGTGFLAGPLAAVLAGRFARERVMIACDVVGAGALVVLLVLPAGPRVVWLYVLAMLLGGGRTVWDVMARSAVPDLVGQDGRVRANGLMVTCRSAATLAGFALAGLVSVHWGPSAAFAIDAGSYLVSAVLVSRVALGPSGGERTGAPWRSTRAAVALLSAAPLLAGMVALRTLDAFGSASHNVGLPVHATIVYASDPATFASLFSAAWAAGSLGAGRLLGRFARDGRGRRPELAFAAGVVVMSFAFTSAFTGVHLVVVMAAAAIAGLADGFTEIAYTSRLQAAPGPERAHLLGFAATVQYGAFGAGSLVCAAAMERFAPLTVVAFAHGVPVAAAVVFFLLARRRAPAPIA